MITISQILFCALYSIGILLLFIGIGYLVYAIRGRNNGQAAVAPSFYQYGIVGLALTVSLYAILATAGKTILLPVPVLIWFSLQKRDSIASAGAENRQGFDWPGLFLSWLLPFLFFVFAFWSFHPDEIKYVAGDFNIYYRMAMFLNERGVEAYNFNMLQQPYITHPAPYHFGDLWFYGLSGRLVGNQPSPLFLIAFSVLAALFAEGVKELFTRGVKSGFYINLLRILLVLAGLFAGMELTFPSFLRRFCEPYTLSIFNWGKILLLSTFVVGILSALKAKARTAAVVLIAITALFYINAAPALFLAAFLLLTIALCRRKIDFTSWLKLNAWYVVPTALTVAYLYVILPKVLPESWPHAYTATEAIASPLKGLSPLKYLKTAINIFIGGFFQLFTLAAYFAIAIYAMIVGKVNWRQAVSGIPEYMWYTILLFVAGLASWAAMHPMAVDTVQFFHNIIGIVYVFLIGGLLVYVSQVLRNRVATILMTLAVVGGIILSTGHIFFTWKYPKAEWEHLQQFTSSPNSRWVNLKSQKEFSYWSIKKTDQYIPLCILNNKWPGYFNTCLNAPFIPIDKQSLYAFEEQKDKTTQTFYQYYNAKHAEDGTLDFGSIAETFIKEYKVGYFCVSSDTVLPERFRPLVSDSLMLSYDRVTVYKIK